MAGAEHSVNRALEWPVGACSIDHDGCVVCSDAGIPMRVVSVDVADALCEDVSGAQMLVAVELVQPVEIGDIVLTHGGVAIARAATQDAHDLRGDVT